MAKSVKKLDSKQIAILKKVLRYMKRYWFFLGLSLVLAAVTVASTLYLPLLIGDAVDCLLGPGKVDFDGLFSILATMGVLIAVTAFAQWVMNVCNNKMTYQIVRDIRNEAFAKMEILPLKYIDGHAHGEVVSRVIADVDQFSDGLLMGFTQFFTGILTILGSLGIMLFLNPGITAIVVLLTPLSLFVAGFIGSPSMNFFDAYVGEEEGKVVVYLGGSELGKKVFLRGEKAEVARQREMNKKVVLGIRPEDVYDYKEAKERGIHMDTQGLEETVSAREMLGAEVILYFDAQGKTHAVRLSPENQTQTGEKADFYFDTDRIHIFDKETEENIYYREEIR